MKKAIADFFKLFQPKYSVVVNMYHVIPGVPVQKQSHIQEFGNGEETAASSYYHKVIRRHNQLGFPNTEIQLIKGKKTVIETKTYGPVSVVKSMNVQQSA